MYTIYRFFYRAADRLALRYLSVKTQSAIKNRILRIARRMYPEKIVVSDASQLLLSAAGQEAGWSWRPPGLPDWVKQEMLALSSIDLDIHPQSHLMRSAEFYPVAWSFDIPGQVYASLWHEVGTKKFDCVIFVPWLKRGGADLGAILTANALNAQFYARVLVISTIDADSPWASRLSSEVTFLEVGSRLRDLDPVHQIDVVARLLLQLSPKVVHIINSPLGWEVIARNGLALKQTMKLYASLFCDDIGPLGLPDGYARTFLPRCYSYLDAVAADNTRNPSQWVRQLGVPSSLFKVIPFPAPAGSSGDAVTVNVGFEQLVMHERAVLWAGRLDRQKRPELLAALAKALPDVRFDVHGESVLDGSNVRWFDDLPNVVFHGKFESFREIVKSEHAAFIYTTAWDGMPLVLLDAASAGLPIVAPDIGGISDFIDCEDLLSADADVSEYAEDIESLFFDAQKRAGRIWRQNEKLKTQRSFNTFLAALGSLEGYLEIRRSAEASLRN